jgi:hypothetical protein
VEDGVGALFFYVVADSLAIIAVQKALRNVGDHCKGSQVTSISVLDKNGSCGLVANTRLFFWL